MTGQPGAGCSRTTSRRSAEGSTVLTLRHVARLVAVAALLALVAPGGRGRGAGAAEPDPGWLEVDYRELVDRRRLTHSGDSVGTLLSALDGRGAPPPGERPGDLAIHALLDPLLEPYAFVLPDALDSAGSAPDRIWFEVGALWAAGEPQPAWVELLRARRFVVESDGDGRFRLCLPSISPGDTATTGKPPGIGSVQAARESYEAAWPILRHVFAAERRRLSKRDGNRPEDHPLDVECHAYVHERARALFHLGSGAFRVRVADAGPRGDRPPVDLESIQSFLDRGLQLEGGRLERDGTLRLFGSESRERPSVLGRSVSLADYAAAYRAVFHGGLAEPYMSLDRGISPQSSIVNYGGRLRDTSLGLVSLLCDIRFKTFSMGIDIVQDRDVREALRREIPSFHTHLERLAADPRSSGMQGQQTRLWFYPDDVDLTLSEQGDVLVLRKCRMTASSERVQESGGAKKEENPWTTETVAAINRDYDKLGRFFPELLDLDQVVRLLSLFTWLRQAQADGLPVPDLDALLAVELPSEPTPRRFPQLLAFNALPPPGGKAPVDVFSRLPVGQALDRLQPASEVPLPAARRLDRALKALDRRASDHAALAREIEAQNLAALGESALDGIAFRAERLRMHQLVLSTLAAPSREALIRREQAGERLRVFSVGIGGLDLGMGKSLERASRRSQSLVPGPGLATPTGPSLAAPSEGAADWRKDPAALPATLLPEHGPAPSPPAGSGERSSRDLGPHSVERGVVTMPDGRKLLFGLAVLGKDGPEPTSRRLVVGPSGRVEYVERLDRGEFLRFRIDPAGTVRSARRLPTGLPVSKPSAPSPVAPPEDLAILALAEPGGTTEAPSVLVKLQGAGPAEMAASLPRNVLQRLILGPDVDLAAGQPLPGLGAPGALLGSRRHAMVVARDGQGVPPWETPLPPLAGEEDPASIARALRAWWAKDPEPPGVFVGTDPSVSAARWQKAPRPGRNAVLILPSGAFPGAARSLRDELAASWEGGRVEADLSPAEAPALVVVASAEAPGLLGARLRRLARTGALRGRLLAVYALRGPLRADLPASLLAEGNLAGLGVAEAPPTGIVQVEASLRSLAAALAEPAGVDRRVEDLPGPFLWFF